MEVTPTGETLDRVKETLDLLYESLKNHPVMVMGDFSWWGKWTHKRCVKERLNLINELFDDWKWEFIKKMVLLVSPRSLPHKNMSASVRILPLEMLKRIHKKMLDLTGVFLQDKS